MKRASIFIAALLILTVGNLNSQTLTEILASILKEANNSVTAMQSSVKTLPTHKFIVNGASKARFSGGKTRESFKVELPQGTKAWYYRVTVLDVNSTYNYQDNESFGYLLANNKYMDVYKPTTENVEFYILGHSGDVASFMETGNNNFRAFQDYSRVGTNSFVGKCNIVQENLWIGIKNPNAMTGLQVIVEVVAWGNFN